MEMPTVNHLVAALPLALTFGGMTFFSAVFTKLPMKIAGPFIRQVSPGITSPLGAAILIALSALILDASGSVNS